MRGFCGKEDPPAEHGLAYDKTAFKETMSLHSGTSLGPYEILTPPGLGPWLPR
jgi:hypothetical protein